MLAGLRSRWTTPLACAACTARASTSTNCAARRARLRRAVEVLGQAAAGNVLQDKIRPAGNVADIVNLNDIRMLQPCDDSASARKRASSFSPACAQFRASSTPRCAATQVAGLEDDAHAASPEDSDDFVAWHGSAILNRLTDWCREFALREETDRRIRSDRTGMASTTVGNASIAVRFLLRLHCAAELASARCQSSASATSVRRASFSWHAAHSSTCSARASRSDELNASANRRASDSSEGQSVIDRLQRTYEWTLETRSFGRCARHEAAGRHAITAIERREN